MDAMMMLKVMALGMGTVFIVLILLIGMIELINTVLGGGKKKKRAPEKAAIPAAAEAAGEEDECLIAVITAAVCACLNTSTHNFRVRSIRERHSRWGRR